MKKKVLKDKYVYYKQYCCRFFQGRVAHLIGSVRGNVMTTFWGFNNFGDLITPVLLQKIGYTPVNSMDVNSGEFIFVGSILDSIHNDYNGVILGSGFLKNNRQKQLKKATVLGVRGEFSKKLLGIEERVHLGDGGLILPKFFKERPAKKYKIGIIPHYSDIHDVRILNWMKNFGDSSKIISVCRDAETVFYDICSCEYIISSSLHGLVVADSLGISNLWIKLSDLCGSGEFKFHDYYTAFSEKRYPYVPTGNENLSELIERTLKPSGTVPDVIDGLYELFLSLPNYFSNRLNRP